MPSAQPPSERVALVRNHADFEAAIAVVVAELARRGYSEASRFAVRLAAEEAVTNALRHGSRSAPAGAAVQFEADVADNTVRVVVQDQGKGFNPDSVPDPRKKENLELPTGRGLLLMRAYMTRVAFNKRGNRVEMTYQRPKPKT